MRRTYLSDMGTMDQDNLLAGIHLGEDMLADMHLEEDMPVEGIHMGEDMLEDMPMAGIHMGEGIRPVGIPRAEDNQPVGNLEGDILEVGTGMPRKVDGSVQKHTQQDGRKVLCHSIRLDCYFRHSFFFNLKVMN